MTDQDSPHVAVRFVKNWAGVWSKGIKSITGQALALLLLLGAMVAFTALVIAPMVAYQAYFYGIGSLATTQPTLTGWDGRIVLVIEVVWLFICISGLTAADRTYYDDGGR